MCGIAGMAGTADASTLQLMLERIHHRGPNDRGLHVAAGSDPASRAAIGNTRLSILDLSPLGHQPMCNEDEKIWVAYNGEIFNFQELRRELIAKGHVFRSNTDTEILPHLFEDYGPKMVERLNGMFAISVWDARERTMWLFRDRIGIKPLYYTIIGERLYFASELKCLLLVPGVNLELRPKALSEFLTLLYVPNPGTMFQHIHKLAPASTLRWRAGQVSIDTYWSPRFGPYFNAPEEELAAELRQKLAAATERQLISDVPIGFFLSGGLDSSTLVACAAQSHSDLKCYTIGFKDEHGRLEQSQDDAHYARVVARHYGAKLREIVVEPNVVDLLEKVVYHMDDPVADHAAIATYLICEQAKDSVVVLLSGQGGDEVFAGYRAHMVDRITARLRQIPRPLRAVALQKLLPFVARHGFTMPGVSTGLRLAFTRHLSKLLQFSELAPRNQYTAIRSYFQPEELDQLLAPDLSARSDAHASQDIFATHFDEVNGEDFVNQMLYVDMKTFLPDLNLAYSDKMSMANSIEVRVPLLDNEVIDFMSQVRPDLKIRGWEQKYLLKKAVKGMVPDAVINRRKAGFGLPVRSWLRGELREMLHDLLTESRVRSRGLFQPVVVSRMLRENQSGERDYTLQLWALLTLELWYQGFTEQTTCTAAVAR
ncbi:MAG: asnB 1 [Acidobacteriaceae bacterium]|nr:asnB 1 [Acidobacteriaceae bacterium]